MAVGEIAYESPCAVGWKITDWETFYTTLEVLSPEFKFMNEKGFIHIVSCEANICLFLHFMSNKITILGDNVWFNLRVKASNGKEHIIYTGNLITFSDTIKCKCIVFGKSKLKAKVRALAANEVLTLYCDLQYRMKESESREDKEKIKEKVSNVEEQNKDDEGKDFHGTTALLTMSNHFKDLLLTGEASDITIKVNDDEFHVHKLILSARSPVFASMFKHDMKEKSTGIVENSDFTAKAFYDLLVFLYSGKLEEFSREKVFDLYLAADKYEVKELKSDCVKFIEKDLCIDTICDALLIALRHKESLLLETICKFFAKNMKEVIITVKWRTFIKENPIECNELFIKALNIN